MSDILLFGKHTTKDEIMKKWFVIGAFLCGILGVQTSYAQCGGRQSDACCDKPTGECYCKYVRYEPCYYTTKRCIDEQVPCVKRCCRMKPEYYQVRCCRMVPEYYYVTKCRQCPEYYDVTEYKCQKKVICEPQCKYVPKYYWKRTCCN